MNVKSINLASGCCTILGYCNLALNSDKMLVNNLSVSEVAAPVLGGSLIMLATKEVLTTYRNLFANEQIEFECASALGPKRYR